MKLIQNAVSHNFTHIISTSNWDVPFVIDDALALPSIMGTGNYPTTGRKHCGEVSALTHLFSNQL